jgi:hypothetical protein
VCAVRRDLLRTSGAGLLALAAGGTLAACGGSGSGGGSGGDADLGDVLHIGCDYLPGYTASGFLKCESTDGLL